MKILQIIFHLGPGGAERFVVDLSNELAKNNDVTLLTLKDDTVDSSRTFYLHDVSKQVTYKNLGLKDGISPIIWYKVWKAIKEINPDVVHFHSDNMPLWVMPAIMLLSKRTIFVQTIHNDIHNGYDNWIYKIYMFLFGNTHRVRFAALSPTNYQELIRVYPHVIGTYIVNGRAPILPSKHIESVQNELSQYRHNNATKLFLHVARCHEIKNQKRLITSFNRFIANGYDACLIIIGADFDSGLGTELQSIAGPNIHFLGTRTNISDYHLCCDLFCLSSDFEGMPITLLEAMLAGKPIISTPVCGAVDVVKNGINGTLTADFTDEAYYDALVSTYKKLQELTDGAKQNNKCSEYTIECCAKKYLDFYTL